MSIITDSIAWISATALAIIEQTGYIGVFILSAVESAGIPVPSEVVVPFAGFLAATGRFDFWLVVIVASVANLVGSLVLYAIGATGGRILLERYGKYVLIRSHDLLLADQWFSRHGAKAVFFGRMLPIIRTFISLPAGIVRMPLGTFVVFTLLGALPWNTGLAYAGLQAGENWDVVRGYFVHSDVVIGGILVALVVWYGITRIRRRKRIAQTPV
jgi:membrane protein DedA with SNARE-associated domain